MCNQVQYWENFPNLVTLHKGKWEENGTITKNRSQTPHDGIDDPECMANLSVVRFLPLVIDHKPDYKS